MFYGMSDNIQDMSTEIEDLRSKLKKAVRFQMNENVHVEKRDEDDWCVTVFNVFVLDRDLKRHYEPRPSSRTEEFISATRFSLDEAMKIADKYVARDLS